MCALNITEKLSKFLQIGGTWNWKHIVSAITFANSGLVLLILFRTLFPALPLYYVTHVIAAIISALWILGTSIAFCRQLYGTSRTIKGFSRHVVRLLCVCFLLFVLYVLYLALGLLGGTLTGRSQIFLISFYYQCLFNLFQNILSVYGAELKCLSFLQYRFAWHWQASVEMQMLELTLQVRYHSTTEALIYHFLCSSKIVNLIGLFL